MKKSIANSSLCFGLYEGNPQAGESTQRAQVASRQQSCRIALCKQVGFARVISDFATFAYLADVFVLEPYRGFGLGKWLVQVITDHPDLQVRSFLLATRDAHSLYARYGFQPVEDPMRYMRKFREPEYLQE